MECPKGCFKESGNVIGFMVYFDDSKICKAAIHSGYIDD